MSETQLAEVTRERDHWHAHYDAAQANWTATLDRAEQAEAQLRKLAEAVLADDPELLRHRADAVLASLRVAGRARDEAPEAPG